MTDRMRDLGDLARLTGMIRDSVELRMAALRQTEQALQRRLRDIDSAAQDREAELTPEDIALRAGADVRWHQWIDRTRAGIGLDLARNRAAIERLRQEFVRAESRRIASDRMMEEATRARALAQARQDERNGPG